MIELYRRWEEHWRGRPRDYKDEAALERFYSEWERIAAEVVPPPKGPR
jgi:hypothetical protein